MRLKKRGDIFYIPAETIKAFSRLFLKKAEKNLPRPKRREILRAHKKGETARGKTAFPSGGNEAKKISAARESGRGKARKPEGGNLNISRLRIFTKKICKKTPDKPAAESLKTS